MWGKAAKKSGRSSFALAVAGVGGGGLCHCQTEHRLRTRERGVTHPVQETRVWGIGASRPCKLGGKCTKTVFLCGNL